MHLHSKKKIDLYLSLKFSLFLYIVHTLQSKIDYNLY